MLDKPSFSAPLVRVNIGSSVIGASIVHENDGFFYILIEDLFIILGTEINGGKAYGINLENERKNNDSPR